MSGKSGFKNIAIIGMGLLGTSLGLALKGKKIHRIGWSRREESRNTAFRMKAIDEIVQDPVDAISRADLSVICLPVQNIIDFCTKHSGSFKKGSVVTDVGSVKGKIVKEIAPVLRRKGVEFVGSHPMAGSEQSGPEAAVATLYSNAIVFVTPHKSNSRKAADIVRNLWLEIGAMAMDIDPFKHDSVVAHTSHVPHITACMLALTVLDCDPEIRRLREKGCAGGFRDTTRVASSSPQIWREIIETNSDQIIHTLDEVISNLCEFRRNISKSDFKAVEKKLLKAKSLRDEWIKNRK